MSRTAKDNKRIPPRNPLAVHAKSRGAGKAPMKHRLEPKKGAKNDQAELLNDVYDFHCGGKDCGSNSMIESITSKIGDADRYLLGDCICDCDVCRNICRG
jgi:hypothetical protein